MEREQAKRKKRKSPNSSQKKRPPENRKKSSNRNEARKSSDSRNQSKNKSQKKRKSLDNRNRNNSISNQNPRRKQASKKPPSTFDEKIKPLIRSVLNIAFYVFIIVIIFTAVMFNLNDDTDKVFFGYRIMTVKSNSMAPQKDSEYKDGFVKGDVIILKQKDANNLEVGDIITYFPSRTSRTAYLTHRVVAVNDELDGKEVRTYTTKGDANDGNDPPVFPEYYLGTVVYVIPKIGSIIMFVQGNLFVVLLLGIAVFCFYVTLRYYLSMPN